MYKNLLYFNGIAVALAVLNHSIYRVLPVILSTIGGLSTSQVSLVDRYSWENLIVLQLLDQVAVWAVPIFLFISGCFLSIATPKSARTISWPIVLNRCKNIVIPYVIFSALVLSWLVMRGEKLSLYEIGYDLAVKGVIAPYYYVPMLITYLLITPYLVPLARDRWKLLLLIVGIFQISYPLLGYLAISQNENVILMRYLSLFNDWKSPVNLLWFVSGMIIGFRLSESQALFGKLRFIAIILLPLALLLNNLEINYFAIRTDKTWLQPQSTFMYQVSVALFLLIWIGFSKKTLPFQTQMNYLGLISFGVYLLHYPILVEINEILQQYLPIIMNYGIIWAIVLSFVGLLIPVFVLRLFEFPPIRRYKRYFVG